ncbi:hypothetical protein PYW07_010641 [Mythimna separata]|uniref:Uncharacterized protein n=1 Tax=Mythimna separata TaxID=271217 RepID=A0AAD7YAA9_MYTSE|nr:hypothetical protein PYW07_010641 [Mythimna separata]
MANNWWKEPDMGVMSAPVASGEPQGCSAMRMWRNACNTLVAPDADEAWKQVVEASPPESLWHTLRNCVAYQAGVWQNMLNKGMDDVIQPAAFKLAIVLRHTPSELTVKLLSDLLRLHPQSQDLTSYILALLTDDEATWCGNCNSSESAASSTPSSPASSADEESSTTDQVETDADGAEATDVDTNEAAAGGPADSASAAAANAAAAAAAAAVAAAAAAVSATEADAAVPIAPPPFAIPVPPIVPDSTTPGESNVPDSTTNDDQIEAEASDSGAMSVESTGSPTGSQAGSQVGSPPGSPPGPPTPAGPAPLRDLQLFGDCELAVLAASREEYDAHAKLVRAEYSKLTHDNYVELRIKVLNQFNQIPKLFHTPEFECFESAARENIEREILTLREHLLTGRKD